MGAITGATQLEFLELAELSGAPGAPQNVAGIVNSDQAPELALVAVIAALAAKQQQQQQEEDRQDAASTDDYRTPNWRVRSGRRVRTSLSRRGDVGFTGSDVEAVMEMLLVILDAKVTVEAVIGRWQQDVVERVDVDD